MGSQRGVTLLTLAITIVVLIILTFTITVNIEPYKNQEAKTNFEIDMQRLKEEISQYYARVKDIPVINKYTNTSMLEGIKNINDGDEYYVIDVKQLEVELNNGADYYKIAQKDVSEEITDLVDVYIINKESHTIYYPKGAEYNGMVHYRLPEVYSEIVNEPNGSWNGTINEPKIAGTGLKPVYWNGTEWIKLTVDSTKEEWDNWYNYSEKKWANAQSADGSMWVWIPRYEYKIDSTNKTINVRFIPTNVKKGTTGYTTASTGIVKSSDGYTIHPAFMDDSANTYSNGGWDSELPGFWIAKYVAGFQNSTVGEDIKTVEYSDLKYTTINSNFTSNFLAASLTTDTKMSYPVFKANTYAYNVISVADAYLLSQKIATANMYGLSNVDSHLVKNSEWGAVAYLTHSQYGVNGNSTDMNEVTINSKNLNNSIYVNNATSGTKANVYAITSYGNSNTANDVSASSTKNMTGVFDLNGCVWERVAGFYKAGSASKPEWHNAMASSSTTESTRHVTLYESNNKVGDATNETSGWNSDYASFVSSSSPVSVCGGPCLDGVRAGVFAFSYSFGRPIDDSGFRACLAFW